MAPRWLLLARHVRLDSAPPPCDDSDGDATEARPDGGPLIEDAAPPHEPSGGDPTIRVGLMCVHGPQDPFEARFDDVLLEYY